jgi:hypothetical protein
MSRSTEKDLDVEDLEDEFDIDEFRADTAVQEALSKGTDLRQYALEVESATAAAASSVASSFATVAAVAIS